MATIKCPECKHMISTYADRCISCGAPMNILLQMLRTEEIDNKEEKTRNDDSRKAAIISFLSILKEIEAKKTLLHDTSETKEKHQYTVSVIETDFTEQELVEKKRKKILYKKLRDAKWNNNLLSVSEIAESTGLGILKWHFVNTFSFFSREQNIYSIILYCFRINSIYMLYGKIENKKLKVHERLFVAKKEKLIDDRFILRRAIESRNYKYELKELMKLAPRNKKNYSILEDWETITLVASKEYIEYRQKKRLDAEATSVAAPLRMKDYSSIAEPIGKTLASKGKPIKVR